MFLSSVSLPLLSCVQCEPIVIDTLIFSVKLARHIFKQLIKFDYFHHVIGFVDNFSVFNCRARGCYHNKTKIILISIFDVKSDFLFNIKMEAKYMTLLTGAFIGMSHTVSYLLLMCQESTSFVRKRKNCAKSCKLLSKILLRSC